MLARLPAKAQTLQNGCAPNASQQKSSDDCYKE
jgi:hypothetical protein